MALPAAGFLGKLGAMLAKEAAQNHIVEHFSTHADAYLPGRTRPQLSLRIMAPSVECAVKRLNISLVKRYIAVCGTAGMFRVSCMCMPRSALLCTLLQTPGCPQCHLCLRAWAAPCAGRHSPLPGSAACAG